MMTLTRERLGNAIIETIHLGATNSVFQPPYIFNVHLFPKPQLISQPLACLSHPLVIEQVPRSVQQQLGHVICSMGKPIGPFMELVRSPACVKCMYPPSLPNLVKFT